MKILVTGAGALLGQGIIRAIQASSLRATTVSVDPSPYAPGLYWTDSAHLVPLASDPDYLQRIREIIAFERPDVLLVGTDVELPIFARHRLELEELGLHVLVSSEQVVATANDKWLTAEFLRGQGLPHPQSCLAGGEDALIDAVGFPLVVKPRVGARSVGMQVVRSRDELSTALRAATSDVVIQQHVGAADSEFTAGVIYFAGEPTLSIVMRRDLRDGNTTRAFLEEYPEFNEQVRALAHQLKPYGPVNFQFRVSGSSACVFEINARFSGTTPLRAQAGFNEVELCVRHVLEGTSLAAPAVRYGTVFLRYLADAAISREDLVQ